MPLVLSALNGLQIHVATQAHVCLDEHLLHSDAVHSLMASVSSANVQLPGRVARVSSSFQKGTCQCAFTLGQFSKFN